MLHLKRASAGSGKTYDLTKTYIRLLLTYKNDNKKRQLRHEETLRDSLSSIMAVTFTVKATAEMKQRIVEKLADLATADNLGDRTEKDIHYLRDFMEEFRTTRFEIARLAKKALRTLLLHYSDFRVQTIDSFFQSILHTFAYEASLDDNFNMEIDTDYVASVGFDAALDAISDAYANPRENKEVLIWLRKMIDEISDKNTWNVFARINNDRTLYGKLVSEARNLEKEQFQKIREELTDYFEQNGENFAAIVDKVNEKTFRGLKELHDKRRDAARELTVEMRRAGLSSSSLKSGVPKRFEASLEDFDAYTFTPPETMAPRKTGKAPCLNANAEKELKAEIARRPDLNETYYNDLGSAFEEWMEANNAMIEYWEENRRRILTWLAYRDMFPKLVVVLEIARKKREYLAETNSLEISETAHILSRIIGEEETPFVYERMGTRLNHYLIDEFQDTSRMQWDNFRPLLLDSNSNGNDNLIIGDAKQSIYRFRNADYRLISESVEREFGKSVEATTGTTNFRSQRAVVEFNNYVFSNIIGRSFETKNGELEPLFSDTIKRIYESCRQELPPESADPGKPRKPFGFVSMTVAPTPKGEEGERFEKIGNANPNEHGFTSLPGLIMSLRDRGFHFKDIGILVKTHDEGKAAVRVITEYNATHPDDKITVISEENLLVASSLSVKIILEALRTMVGNVQTKVEPNTVLEEPVDEKRLYEMLRSMQSLALPSIVEAIVDRFVPAGQRDKDAPFIAAFQDAVLDYTSGHSSDIGSFLKWWERKSGSLSIVSPEDSDGVVVQTIHKAKGLEYPCVIIPKANVRFRPTDKKIEWRWVRPVGSLEGRELLPPWVPVETKDSLSETEHADLHERFYEEVALDELNKMYVAFTRPKAELHLFYNISSRTGSVNSLPHMREMLLSEAFEVQRSETLSRPLEIEEDEKKEMLTIRFGEPLTAAQIEALREEREVDESQLTTYHVASERKVLQTKPDDMLLHVPVHTGAGEEELDPRAEGTLKHRIMQMVTGPDDLDRALRIMEVNGFVSPRQMEEWGKELRSAIEGVASYGWFSPDVRVLNERAIICRGSETTRPDRVVITPEGDAVVIDYKFGEEDKEYARQVAGYMDSLKKMKGFRSVKGYIWYVHTGKVDPV
ncbi:MAG: UvrD-helicase domain-containing protein [Muribaculaceae bacterium]|nr:UvrD-helicase domain-containing protein [Muribaculaceae bacterium]